MKNLLFFVSLLSSVYSFGQRIPPKIRQKPPEFRHRLPQRLIPIYYAIQMSSDNDDRHQRFQNNFNSRNPIPTSTVPELNFPSPIPQNRTENWRSKLAPSTTATQPMAEILKMVENTNYESEVLQPNVDGTYNSATQTIGEDLDLIMMLKADESTLQKINDFISINSLEDAAKEYDKLNFANSEIKGILQQKFGNEVVQLNLYKVDVYLITNKLKINTINPGKYSLSFDKNGNSSNLNFPSLEWTDVPIKEIGSFSVSLNSKTEINIVLKDSILISTSYSSSNTKPLFIDKNENFYFKTKTGLPVATISNEPSIDKKSVRINKVYKREKYANGILIDTQEFRTEKTVGIQKKDQ